jgi:hypothetical protein
MKKIKIIVRHAVIGSLKEHTTVVFVGFVSLRWTITVPGWETVLDITILKPSFYSAFTKHV